MADESFACLDRFKCSDRLLFVTNNYLGCNSNPGALVICHVV